MFTKLELPVFAFLLLSSTALLGQQKNAPSTSSAAQEFPVVFQESLVAGKTAIGTKVDAKLGMATLVNGTVIPQGAVFSGEVVESAAKNKTEPSKLGIRIDSALWKNGSAALKLYLVGWFYPAVAESGQDLQYGPQQSATGTWNGQGEYPGDNSRIYRPFPSGGSNGDPSAPGTSNSVTSQHRMKIKDVETDRGNDGAITLVSRHSNIKLDKLTTYVLASPELLVAPAKPAAAK